MARLALSGTPKDIIAELSLSASTTYTLQAEIPSAKMSDSNNARGPYVHVDDGDAAPTNTSHAGRKVRSMETIRIKAGAGSKFWAWCPRLTASINVYEDI